MGKSQGRTPRPLSSLSVSEVGQATEGKLMGLTLTRCVGQALFIHTPLGDVRVSVTRIMRNPEDGNWEASLNIDAPREWRISRPEQPAWQATTPPSPPTPPPAPSSSSTPPSPWQEPAPSSRSEGTTLALVASDSVEGKAMG